MSPIEKFLQGRSAIVTGDAARPVAWLVSDYADYITGATLYVDGGMTLYPGFSEND